MLADFQARHPGVSVQLQLTERLPDLVNSTLVKAGKAEEALTFLARLPETDRVRHIAASARLAMNPVDNFDDELNSLLPRVKADETARQEFLDILETMGPSDPRTAKYRRLLSSHLY